MKFKGSVIEVKSHLTILAEIEGKAVLLKMWKCSIHYEFNSKSFPRAAQFNIPKSYARELGLVE